MNTTINEIQAGKAIQTYLAKYCKDTNTDLPSFTIVVAKSKIVESKPQLEWTTIWQNREVNELQRQTCLNRLINVLIGAPSPSYEQSTAVSSRVVDLIFVLDGIEKKLAMAILTTMLYKLCLLEPVEYELIRQNLKTEDIFKMFDSPVDSEK